MQALIINLAKATDRWQFQQKQLSHLGIDYQRIDATQVNDLSKAEYEYWANSWQRKLRQTEVACFLSHYHTWQLVAKNEQPYLILEDDALLSDKLPQLLTHLEQPSNATTFEHITLETRGRKKLINQTPLAVLDKLALHKLYLDRTGACAYIITPAGAQKMLKYVMKKGAGLADALLCHNPALQSFQTIPALSIQMDMMVYYDVNLPLTKAASSHISTTAQAKPQANTPMDNINFKCRRLFAQMQMGLTQLRYWKQEYRELSPDNQGMAYLTTIL